MTRQISQLLKVLVLAAMLAAGISPARAEPDNRPNILLIVADDLGLADLGVYGSSIRTPNIDRLASQGIRFSQFHAAPMCAPTRAMLFSGNNNTVAGMARQYSGSPLHGVAPGYEGHLSDRVAPLPRLLAEAGYHTYAAGKWHLGDEDSTSPRAAGFERSFMLLEGGGNHFNDVGYKQTSTYREDGVLAPWPEGAYSTELYTDRLIGYIESNRADGKPFFAFAAYTSPHWPLQVPAAELDRYAGAYDEGYDALREANFATLRKAGIVAADAKLPPRNPEVKPWSELTPEERRIESREMELYAAMVENLDGHVGRLLQYLEEAGLYDTTLIVFMSDNGAAAEDLYAAGPFAPYLREHYDNRLDNMGKPGSFVSYGQAWAEAGSAPYRLTKGYTTEGGMVAPLIVAGPGLAGSDVINHAYLTVMDLAPTFIDLAGARYPDDGSVQPMRGTSLWPLLSGAAGAVHGDDYVTTMFHWGRAFIRQGDWKLVAIDIPFEESGFQLFNLAADPGETNDLSASEPGKRAELVGLWRQQRRELGIVLPEDL